jgi:hypothetical protein
MRTLLAVWLIGACACLDVRTTNLATDRDAGLTHTPDAAHPAADAAHQPSARCGTRFCACDDGVDNDQDGLVDGLDPECTGSFDDDEATFAIGKPNKQGPCRDCFWDDNAGGGKDSCRYAAECLSGAAPGGKGKGNCSCEVTQPCIDYCRVRTPNGCDCFGCCDVVRGQGSHVFVELSEGCALDRLDDVVACPRCTPNTACQNSCGRCELCLGKRLSDLPADCANQPRTGTMYACDEGQALCASSMDCAGASYCYLGCCLVDLL